MVEDSDDMFRGQVQDGNSNAALTHFQKVYPDEEINKEDLFYYLYGVLHSEDYRTRYRNNLMKQLPRLPVVTDGCRLSLLPESRVQTGRAASRL